VKGRPSPPSEAYAACSAGGEAGEHVGHLLNSLVNPADHSKRGKQSLLSDLVIECLRRRKNRRSNVLAVRGIGHGSEMKNLHAIGLALAECVNRREGNIEALFEENAERLKCRKILIRRGGR